MRQCDLFDGRTTLFPRSPRQRAIGKRIAAEDKKRQEAAAWFAYLQAEAEKRKRGKS